VSKKQKGYRKVKAIPGTIFDGKLEDEVLRQRRCGFFYLHGVNPAAVAFGQTSVESIGGSRVRVYYEAIYVPEGQSEWPGTHEGRLVIPAGVWCEHGGYAKRHTVKQIRSIDADLSEILA
jgi:hypothetical protein